MYVCDGASGIILDLKNKNVFVFWVHFVCARPHSCVLNICDVTGIFSVLINYKLNILYNLNILFGLKYIKL